MAGIGLLAVSGSAKRIAPPTLEAHLVVQEFLVPTDFGIEPEQVADFLADKLSQRIDDDLGIRLTLKADVVKQVKEFALPRLMNVVVVRAMMRDIPELSTILTLGNYRQTVKGHVFASKNLTGVALTLPNALLAEVNGEKVQITETSTGMTALELGDIASGQMYQVTVWLGEDSLKYDLGRTIRIGDKNGARGRVLLWGSQGWFGADLEALRWSRWLVGTILAGTLIVGIAGLILTIKSIRRTRAL